MNEGYIRLYSSMTEWEWYRNINTKVVFLHLLLKANWQDGRFEGMSVPRGSLITSRKSLAAELGISEQAVRTALGHLEETGEITKTTTKKWTLIKVVNYQIYQDLEGEKSTNKQPTNQPTINQAKRLENKGITGSDDSKSTNRATTIEDIYIGYSDIYHTKSNSAYIYPHTLPQNDINFDRFWGSYPKKKAKKDAQKAFAKLNPDDELMDEIMTALEEQKNSRDWKKQNGQYIPYPATWLNGRRWEDKDGTAEDDKYHIEF